MKTLMIRVCLGVVFLLTGFNAVAADGVRLAAGGGEGATDVYKISLLKGFDKKWFDGRVAGHWELGFSHWDASKGPVDDVQGISFAPVFVYDFGRLGASRQPYIEYSVGLIYLSEDRIASNKLGQRWQFDNRLGVGVRFGPNQRHDLSISFRHVSNASTDDDNDGFDSSQLAYTYHYF